MGNDEVKFMAQIGSAQLADHFLTINNDNSKTIIKKADLIAIVENPTLEFLQETIPRFRVIAMLTGAHNDSSGELVECLNELIDELQANKERFYYPLAVELYKKTVQACNIAIQKAGSVTTWAFLNFFTRSLSKISLGDEKTFIPKFIKDSMNVDKD